MARYKKRPIDQDIQPGLFDDLIPQLNKGDDIPRHPSIERHAMRSLHGGSPTAATEPVPSGIEPLPSTSTIDRLRFICFGSGSSGNCAYLGDDRFGILIDAGIDPAKITAELTRNAITMDSIGGIILTHDHGDHIRYAYAIVRKYRHIRIYCTPKTLNGILRRHNISRRIKDYHQPIFKEFPFHIGNFVITPFEVMHDGTDNSGFFISAGNQKFVVATDLGKISERADFYMRQANHLMIECNYDRTMLLNGPYPEYLKGRILADNGHMDNEATAAYLSEICSPKLHNIFLCHLSHDNNTPEKAIETVRNALEANGITVGDGSGSIESRKASTQVSALPRFESTGLIILRNDTSGQ